ncbi:MAG TPA: tetratricopeptide repeat protein [Kofleriaceae bacterium]|nr:tetratricopeptide repeat protein [Kofleriaceae bacterium]
MSQAAADALVREADELYRTERFADAAARFQRAVTVFPKHAVGWKGLGNALLNLGRPHDAARAFDQAIGLQPGSASALWGGALAHAEIGNKVIAQNYLRRTLVLQPQWIEMAEGTERLAPLVEPSARAADVLRRAFGPFATRAYRRGGRTIEIGRVAERPRPGQCTFVTFGLAKATWNAPARPRVELVLASNLADADVCGHILASVAFHLADAGFYPEPGTIVRDGVIALEVGELSYRLPHIYMCAPRAWELALPLDAGPPAITLVQVFPISDRELQEWYAIGSERFEHTLGARGVDVGDLRRAGC